MIVAFSKIGLSSILFLLDAILVSFIGLSTYGSMKKVYNKLYDRSLERVSIINWSIWNTQE